MRDKTNYEEELEDKLSECGRQLKELKQRILALPTWVEYDSYTAQVDMRRRAADLVDEVLHDCLHR